MEPGHRFFENRSCKYFPCHDGMEGQAFNCLFCYCPLNPYRDCPGKPVFRKNKEGHTIKDCTGCTFPHLPENYDVLLAFLREKLRQESIDLCSGQASPGRWAKKEKT